MINSNWNVHKRIFKEELAASHSSCEAQLNHDQLTFRSPSVGGGG